MFVTPYFQGVSMSQISSNLNISFNCTLSKVNSFEPLTFGIIELANLSESCGYAIRKLVVLTAPIDQILKAVAVPFIEIADHFEDIWKEESYEIKILKGTITPIWLPVRIAVKTACFAIYFFTIGLHIPYERIRETFISHELKNASVVGLETSIANSLSDDSSKVPIVELQNPSESPKAPAEKRNELLLLPTNSSLSNLLKDFGLESHPDFADIFDVLFKHFNHALLGSWEKDSDGIYTGVLTNAIKVWIPLPNVKYIRGGVIALGENPDHKISISLSQNSIKINEGLALWCKIPILGIHEAKILEVKRLDDGFIQIEVEMMGKIKKKKLGKRDNLLKDWSEGTPVQDSLTPIQFLNLHGQDQGNEK